jgi:serine protease Do
MADSLHQSEAKDASPFEPQTVVPVTDSRTYAGDRSVVRGAEPSRTAPGGSTLFFTLPRLAALMVLWAVLQYLIPYLLERYHYAAARGRQRAEYEIAVEGLKALSLDGLSKAYQMVSQHVAPSVVHIDIRNESDELSPTRGMTYPFGVQPPVNRGQGSGVIVDAAGYIVTNYHVVEQAGSIRVSLSDGRNIQARVVGFDPMTDLALLKIDAHSLIAAEWGDSDELAVGALVWAVGSPFGLQSTTTFGILSGKHRAGMGAGEVYQDFLQTDAAVNPGNSGGPLVDVRGKIVGINTAIVGEAFQGVSFAIPSRVAKHVVERLKVAGRVARGWLGVELRPVSDEDMVNANLPDTQGAWIVRCHDDHGLTSPARQAGIQAGDVIIRWNDRIVTKPEELIRAVGETEVYSTAVVVIRREGQQLTLEVQVAERPVNLRS